VPSVACCCLSRSRSLYAGLVSLEVLPDGSLYREVGRFFWKPVVLHSSVWASDVWAVSGSPLGRALSRTIFWTSRTFLLPRFTWLGASIFLLPCETSLRSFSFFLGSSLFCASFSGGWIPCLGFLAPPFCASRRFGVGGIALVPSRRGRCYPAFFLGGPFPRALAGILLLFCLPHFVLFM